MATSHHLEASLARARAGETDALASLLDKLRPYVRLLLRPRLGLPFSRKFDDSDLIQETLLRVHQQFDQFRGQEVPQFLGWVGQIAVHVVATSQRHYDASKRDIGRERFGVELLGRLRTETNTPEQRIIRDEEAARLATALECLPEVQREVIQARFFLQFPFADIAKQTGKSVGAVRIVCLRAIAREAGIREAIMSTNADLATWGEPPASTDEDILAGFLDMALDLLARGESADAKRLLSEAPFLAPEGEHLLKDLQALCWAATSVWDHAGLLPSANPNCLGETLPDPFPGEFRIRRLLGSGSFGEVWLADDLNLGRPVAMKMLRVPSAPMATIRNEARLLAALRHPNIVQVYAWRKGANDECLILQFVSGGSLADRVKRDGPLPWQLAARYVADAAEGLLEVHSRGIIHRDVKPANLLWDEVADEALLTDFGVSVRLATTFSSPTEAETVAGTPHFMAPEAFAGSCTLAVDVYGLGATLYFLITGEVPFPASKIGDLLKQIELGLPDPDHRCRALPARLERLLRDSFATDPVRRPSLSVFAVELRGSLNQLLADALGSPRVGTTVDLRLIVSHQVAQLSGQAVFVPLVATVEKASGQLLRDLKRVPPPANQVCLRTGERLRVEVVADSSGYVTVFNVGPTGNLNLLYPLEAPHVLAAGQVLPILDVELTPPAGRERLFALWSRTPLPLRAEELLRFAERDSVLGAGPYRATREMVRMQESILGLAAEDWRAVVLELHHTS